MIAKYYKFRRSKKEAPEVFYKACMITDTHLRFGVDGDPNANGAQGSGSSLEGRVYYASNSKLRNFIDLVGVENPDFVMHLGDMCDTPNDYPFFVQEWSELPYQKAVAVGNHDLDDFDKNELADAIGYGSNPILGGSKFNQSFTSGAENNVRIIILDSQYDENDNDTRGYRDLKISDSGVDFLIQEIEDCQEKHVLIFSHVLPHYSSVSIYYIKSEATLLSARLDSALGDNKNILSCNWFGGHWHTPEYGRYDTLTPRCVGYRLPDSIEKWDDNESSENGATFLSLWTDGTVDLSFKKLNYPYL